MKSSDRTILLGLALVGLVAAFWFVILAPKREEASSLGSEVSDLRAQVEQEEQDTATAEAARKDYDVNYRKLVLLGKAVPEDADTPSLLTQLEVLSDRSNVDFRSLELSAGSGSTSAAAAAPAPTTSTSTDPAAGTTVSTNPSEAAAALLPLGATVGPAGLPVMPYSLGFEGGFFNVADFFGRVDGMVHASGGGVEVNGRLLTIDGFDLTAGPNGFPDLTASVQATSYLTPHDQGLAGGATPAGPADATTTAAAPATDTSATPAPSATVTP